MKIICGVDVSKATLDVCIEPGSISGSFKNTTAGIAAPAVFCRQHRADLVVMEATGGFERRAFLLLSNEGLSCAVTNARNVRQYAESMGVLEKTDRIDARIIARFARDKGLRPMPVPSQAQQRIKALVARLRQVTDDLTVQKQRRSSLLDNAEMLASLDEVIALLKRQSRKLEGEIASTIDDDPLWAQLAETWRSVKGVAGLSKGSDTLKLAGERGFIPMSLNLNPAYVSSHWDSVLAGAARTGRTPSRQDWRLVREVFIADTDEEAWKLSTGDMMGRMMGEYFLPLLGHFGFKDYLKHAPDVPDSDVTVDYCARHNWIVGSPSTVAEKIETIYREVGGFGTLLVFGFDYKHKPEAWHRSLTLLQQEVMPRLKHLNADLERAA